MSAEFSGIRPSTADIRIGRLQKRIRKLKNQRDHYQEELKNLQEIVKIYPYIIKTHNAWRNASEKDKRLKELEVTQSMLIKELERYRKNK